MSAFVREILAETSGVRGGGAARYRRPKVFLRLLVSEEEGGPRYRRPPVFLDFFCFPWRGEVPGTAGRQFLFRFLVPRYRRPQVFWDFSFSWRGEVPGTAGR